MSRIGKLGIGVVALLALGWLALRLAGAWYLHASQDPAFFESDIAAFEAAERAHPTPPGAVVFYGSSSIRMWDGLAEDFAPLPVVNRGFGGSQMSHLVAYAKRVVTPLAPRALVVYAGDNDLDAATGKRAEDVARDFQELLAVVREGQPELPVFVLSIKPSRARFERWPEMRRANALLAEIAAGDRDTYYVDLTSATLGPDGQPRSDVFRLDGLHLNARGYAAWTAALRPVLFAKLGVPATP